MVAPGSGMGGAVQPRRLDLPPMQHRQHRRGLESRAVVSVQRRLGLHRMDPTGQPRLGATFSESLMASLAEYEPLHSVMALAIRPLPSFFAVVKNLAFIT